MGGSRTVITILPADKETLQLLAVPEGREAMVLRDSAGRITGHGVFAVAGDTVEVFSAVAEEPILVEGIIRSVLNAGDCRGAVTGLCRVEALAPLLRHLEFEAGEDLL
jgi:hypothetical protein